MKKIYIKMLLPLVAVAFSAIACQKGDDQGEPQPQKVKLEASTGVLSRTSLGENGAVLWSAGDSFELKNAADMSADSEVFSLVSGEGSSVAAFEGVMPAGDVLIGLYGMNCYPFYGNGENNVVGIKLEPVQPFMDASFASRYNPMLAYYEPAQGNDIMFRNVCGLVEFQITGTGTLAELRVSCSDKVMAGIMQVAVEPSSMNIVDVVDEPSAAVTVTGINAPLSESTPVSVYCVLMPGTYEDLNVTMTDTEGNTVTRTATEAVTVERSVVTPVEGLVFDNVVGPALAINVDEELSDCFLTYVTFEFTGNQTADSYVFMSGSKERIDEFMQSSDPVQVLLKRGIPNDGKFSYKLIATPDTNSSIVALALNGGEPVGSVVRYDYMTPSLTIDETLDVTATVDVTGGVANVTVNISGDAIALYSGLWLGGILDGLSDAEIASQLVAQQPAVDVTGNAMYSYQVSDIPEGIELDVFAMVKSETGYSNVFKDTLYVPIEPGEDTAEYRRFIGTWTATGVDQVYGSSISFTVTVEEDVIGKTYKVSGLANKTPGVFDDTIIAVFDGANICFDFGSTTAGLYENMEIMMRPMMLNAETSEMVGLSQYLGTYADGDVYFGGAEYGYDMVDVNVQYIFGSCFDMVWLAEGTSPSGSAVTEGFSYAEPVAPVWK